MFRDETGEPLKAATVRKRLQGLARGLGLQIKRFGLQSFRHAYVSTLGDTEPIKYVSVQVGHSNTKITQDIYQHISRERRRDAMERLDARGGELMKGPMGPLATRESDAGDPAPLNPPEPSRISDVSAP